MAPAERPAPETAVLLSSFSSSGRDTRNDDIDGEWKTMPTSTRPLSLLPTSRLTITAPVWLRPFIFLVIFLTCSVGYELYARGPLPSTERLTELGGKAREATMRWKEVALPSGISLDDAGGKGVCEGQFGCRFLVPTTIGEQESRAQLHILQLAALATSLNRTLVLPRAYPSRFSTCGTSAFDYYYSPSSFATSTGTSPVLQRDFEVWLDKVRGEGETAMVKARAVRMTVPMDNETAPDVMGKLVPDLTGGGKEFAPCLDESALDFGGREPLAVWELREFDSLPLLDDLRILDEQDPVDVLLVNYNLRGPLFALPSRSSDVKPFEYQSEWHSIADLVLEAMGGTAAVGVHWRTESLEAERLETCGTVLEDALLQVQEGSTDIKGVYLASDFPIETLAGSPSRLAAAIVELSSSSSPDSPFPSPSILPHDSEDIQPITAHSDTLTKYLTPSHFSAMTSFLSSYASHICPLPPLHTYASLLPSLLFRAPSLTHWLTNDAARAIVDQLVLQRTEVFLAGYPTRGSEMEYKGRGSCGKHSNWTGRVMRARKDEWNRQKKVGVQGEGERRLRNVMGWWSAEGTVDGV